MNPNQLRVAFFTDSFHEVNGVALTSRQLEAFARETGRPMFSCHAGPATATWTEGSITRCEWSRSRVAFGLEVDLTFDLLFWRYYTRIRDAVREFRPDLVHITAPGESSLMGILIARELGVPIAGSWHTNLHQFGARRLNASLSWLAQQVRKRLVDLSERCALDLTLLYYRIPKLLFAPSPELIRLLADRTGRPVHMMSRGVDSKLFQPGRRERRDNVLRLGYVGRVSTEKNVELLAEVERELLARGIGDYEFVVVGHGSRCQWLQSNMRNVRLTGLLRGEDLAREYANFDLFLFPSKTDTFGNVVLEAMASGVPVVVTNGGGPQYLVQDGISGCIARDDREFAGKTIALAQDATLRRKMSQAARSHAVLHYSWAAVFEGLYQSWASMWSPGAGREDVYHPAPATRASVSFVK